MNCQKTGDLGFQQLQQELEEHRATNFETSRTGQERVKSSTFTVKPRPALFEIAGISHFSYSNPQLFTQNNKDGGRFTLHSEAKDDVTAGLNLEQKRVRHRQIRMAIENKTIRQRKINANLTLIISKTGLLRSLRRSINHGNQ